MKTPDAVGRVCTRRCQIWPDELDYRTCPVCKAITKRYRGLTPLEADKAISARKHAEFEDFYEKSWKSQESSQMPSIC